MKGYFRRHKPHPIQNIGKSFLPDNLRDEALLPADAAAEYLGVSRSFLTKLRMTGGGPAYVKFSRRCLYRPADLRAWLDKFARRSTSEKVEA
jgi:hypothetical protein